MVRPKRFRCWPFFSPSNCNAPAILATVTANQFYESSGLAHPYHDRNGGSKTSVSTPGQNDEIAYPRPCAASPNPGDRGGGAAIGNRESHIAQRREESHHDARTCLGLCKIGPQRTVAGVSEQARRRVEQRRR